MRIVVSLDDRSGKRTAELPDHATARDTLDGIPGVIAAHVNGFAADLATTLQEGDEVAPITAESPEGLEIIRHSCAHVLAQAVQDLYPDTRLGTGPPIENGFYYDFLPQQPFTPEDVKSIQKKMKKIVSSRQTFRRRRVSESEAHDLFADEPFKLDIISQEAAAGGAGNLTVYDNVTVNGDVAWTDLCRGPHVPHTGMLSAFALRNVAAAYWRGSEENPQLQRVYGTAWATEQDLRTHLELLEEAARRDHRKLAAQLDLFSFPTELGSGLPVFHPKGELVRQLLEDYSRRRHNEAGYSFVSSPHITKRGLFDTSGHLQWFAEGMFPGMKVDNDEYFLKPMNCPFHILVYRARQHSYRELPLRYAEFGTVYRYEKSGTLHGLTRVRSMTQDDAHIFTTREQMGEELRTLLAFVLSLLRDYGLTDFFLELSTRDDSKEKFVGSPEEWEEATEALREAAEESQLELVPDPGGAAFYGPKISVQARDALGRSWQMSTLQVDFQLPQRFDLEYQAADGSLRRPVMIHRALFGSIERFFAVLLEHYAGAFPTWLAPVQTTVIPIGDSHSDYARAVCSQLVEAGIRATVDDSDARMQKKIRNAQAQKVPYQLIVGDDEIAEHCASIRYRSGEQKNNVPVDDVIAEIRGAIESRSA